MADALTDEDTVKEVLKNAESQKTFIVTDRDLCDIASRIEALDKPGNVIAVALRDFVRDTWQPRLKELEAIMASEGMPPL